VGKLGVLVIVAILVVACACDGDAASRAQPTDGTPEPLASLSPSRGSLLCELLNATELTMILDVAPSGAPQVEAPVQFPSCRWTAPDASFIAVVDYSGEPERFDADLRQISEGATVTELDGIGETAYFVEAPAEADPKLLRQVGAAFLLVGLDDGYLFAVVNERAAAQPLRSLAPVIVQRYLDGQGERDTQASSTP
jgi:hypothetical protein